jgi:hypothetical protein
MQQELEGQLPECKKPRAPLKIKVMEDTMESRKMFIGAKIGQSFTVAICESDLNWGNDFDEGVASFQIGARM